MARLMSNEEKNAILKEVLGSSYQEKTFPAFSRLMDYIGNVNNSVAIVELIPSLNAYLSGPLVSRALTYSSLVGTFLFPLDGLLKVIDANKTGLRMYGYRATAYTLAAWAFEQPVPQLSNKIIINLRSGPIAKTPQQVQEYHDVWRDITRRTVSCLARVCNERSIPEEHLKIIFRAMGGGSAGLLSKQVLESFEDQFSATTKHIWRSNYSVVYPM